MDCFGFSDSEEDNNEPSQRDASCGICSFHPHTESSLLNHVRNSLDASNDGKNDAERVLNAVDEFCIQRHWMMHVGPEKGKILTDTLKEAVDEKLARSSEGAFVLVELGSYCSYSAIRMANDCISSYGDKLKLKLITLEINPEYITVAKELIKLGGLENVISLLEISFNGYDTNMVELLNDELNPKQETIDLLFIDHDKGSYKSDLMKLESAGLVREKTRVVADNVIFAQIDDYLEYVQQRQRDGVVTTKTISCHVEYSTSELEAEENPEILADGIEITDYVNLK